MMTKNAFAGIVAGLLAIGALLYYGKTVETQEESACTSKGGKVLHLRSSGVACVKPDGLIEL
jgi:hypothetical protein